LFSERKVEYNFDSVVLMMYGREKHFKIFPISLIVLTLWNNQVHTIVFAMYVHEWYCI
jgi:hypothetical protein